MLRSLGRNLLKGSLFIGFGLLVVGITAATFAGLTFGTFGVGLPVAALLSTVVFGSTAAILYGRLLPNLYQRIDKKWPPEGKDIAKPSKHPNQNPKDPLEKKEAEKITVHHPSQNQEKPLEKKGVQEEEEKEVEEIAIPQVKFISPIAKLNTQSNCEFQAKHTANPNKQRKELLEKNELQANGHYGFKAADLEKFSYHKEDSYFKLNLPTLDLSNTADKTKTEQAINEMLKHIHLATNSKKIILDIKDPNLLAIAKNQCPKLGLDFTIKADENLKPVTTPSHTPTID